MLIVIVLFTCVLIYLHFANIRIAVYNGLFGFCIVNYLIDFVLCYLGWVFCLGCSGLLLVSWVVDLLLFCLLGFPLRLIVLHTMVACWLIRETTCFTGCWYIGCYVCVLLVSLCLLALLVSIVGCWLFAEGS